MSGPPCDQCRAEHATPHALLHTPGERFLSPDACLLHPFKIVVHHHRLSSREATSGSGHLDSNQQSYRNCEEKDAILLLKVKSLVR